jgi:hypothetical protein
MRTIKKYMEYLGSRIILGQILRKKGAQTGFRWLRIGTSTGILDTVTS